jgi:RNA polymerase sigma factor (sigma-70 family)
LATIRLNGATRRQLQTLFNLGVIGELTDGQLLERFATRSGEVGELAFAALVERHGPMVLRVCRNLLRDPNDVQDAFQATFLVLVQKSRSLWVRDSLGPWLHRVAHRVATRAGKSAARRREHERRAAALRHTMVSEGTEREDISAILHHEVDRLPERYRVPVVLCDLQGLTHEKAARHLGWPVGTVKSRLARARELLRGRLSRRGLGPPGEMLIAERGLGGASRALEDTVPGVLIESTLRTAARFAAGKALAVRSESASVALLIEEVLKTMFLTKLKLASLAMLLFGAAGAVGVLAQQGPRPDARLAAETIQDRPIAESGRPPDVNLAPAPVPAYITQSRAMIITRLEEEVAEARARLDRIHRITRSPDDPAVVRARKTFEDLQQRLEKIDRVLFDAVESYPTMFDFSRGPSDFASSSEPAAAYNRKAQDAGRRAGVAASSEVELLRAQERASWAKQMFEKGYISKSLLDIEIANYETVKARVHTNQPLPESQQKDPQPQQSGLKQAQPVKASDSGRADQAPAPEERGQGETVRPAHENEKRSRRDPSSDAQPRRD